MRLHIIALTAIILAWLLSPAAYGQGLTSLNGLVTDKTGALIPDAEITLQNVDTGFQRIVRSQADGSYAFPQIPPGSYRVVGRTSGFNPVTIDDLRLLVNTPATVNIRFEQVGTLAESVTVQAEAQQINLTYASLGNSF